MLLVCVVHGSYNVMQGSVSRRTYLPVPRSIHVLPTSQKRSGRLFLRSRFASCTFSVSSPAHFCCSSSIRALFISDARHRNTGTCVKNKTDERQKKSWNLRVSAKT